MQTLAASYERHFASLRLVRSSRRIGRTAQLLFVMMLLSFAGMVFLPWQQTSSGTGRVVAYHPTERPQMIESPIYGRVVRWGDGIVEGARVKQGQMILEIRDNDESRDGRLSEQVEAAQAKLKAAQSKSENYGRQILDWTEAREQAIEAARQLVQEAERKLEAEQHGVEAARAAVAQTRTNFERQKRLFEKGFNSGTNFEKDRRSYEEAQAKLSAAEKYVRAADSYLQSKRAELEQKSREANTKIEYARALQQEAFGDAALARKELSEIEGKQAQFASRVVLAPRDATILRLFANDNAEMLKEGDPLFTIVPDTDERAVELWIDGNDIPLITENREVRLQFEGWPAIQFAAGWPQVAMGTFGGRVVAVDETDDGKGKFRILVRPDDEHPWPEGALLRQGSRANGWVLLNTVGLGYELWRQINGFPAVYGDGSTSKTPGSSGDKGSDRGSDKEYKKIKLPK